MLVGFNTSYQIRKGSRYHDCWGCLEVDYHDWGGRFDTLEEAKQAVPRDGGDWQIVEIKTTENTVWNN